jgi:hypothetical protein
MEKSDGKTVSPQAQSDGNQGDAEIQAKSRNLIGQAIIDGLLTVGPHGLLPPFANYNQGGGSYEQWSGTHLQGGSGGYTQHNLQ